MKCAGSRVVAGVLAGPTDPHMSAEGAIACLRPPADRRVPCRRCPLSPCDRGRYPPGQTVPGTGGRAPPPPAGRAAPSPTGGGGGRGTAGSRTPALTPLFSRPPPPTITPPPPHPPPP